MNQRWICLEFRQFGFKLTRERQERNARAMHEAAESGVPGEKSIGRSLPWGCWPSAAFMATWMHRHRHRHGEPPEPVIRLNHSVWLKGKACSHIATLMLDESKNGLDTTMGFYLLEAMSQEFLSELQKFIAVF